MATTPNTSKTSSPIPTARPVRPAAPQPNPSISNKTLEVSQHTQAPESKSLEVSQENAGVTAIQKIMGDNTLTVEQKREKLSKLPQSEEKDKAIKGLEEATIDNKPKLREDKGEDNDDKFEPFKEQDILQYMYDQWLLGGMNVICNWGYHKTENLCRWASNGVCDGLSNVYHGIKDEWRNRDRSRQPTAGQASQQSPQQTAAAQANGAENNSPTSTDRTAQQSTSASEGQIPQESSPLDKMQECLVENNQIYNDFISNKIQKFDDYNKKELSFYNRVLEGKETEEDRKRPMYKTFVELPPEIRKQRIQQSAHFAETSTSFISATMRLASIAVFQKNTQRAMEQQKPLHMSRATFEREAILVAMMINHQIINMPEKNREKFLEDLAQKQESAGKFLENEIKNGNYAVKGKAPKKNPYLQDTYKMIGLNENGSYSTPKMLELINKEPSPGYEKVFYNIIAVDNIKSSLQRIANQTQMTTTTAKEALPDSSDKKQTMPKELRNQQERQEIINKNLESTNGKEIQITGIQAANDDRRAHAANRIAQIRAFNNARGATHIVQTDRAVANSTSQQSVYKIPLSFKGPDR